MRRGSSLLMTSFIIANLFIKATALAGGIETQVISPFSNGYFGVGVGPSFQSLKQHNDKNITDTVLPEETHSSLQQGNVVFVGNAHLGYGHSFHDWYLGAELFGEWYSHPTAFRHTSS